MSIFIMAQIVGLIGIICGMITFHTKDMRGARKWKLTIDILWALHYLLLGALTGFGTSVIAACREIVFLNDHKKICQLKMWPWFFIVLNFISAYNDYTGPLLYLDDASMWTVSLLVARYGDGAFIQYWSMRMAGGVIAMIPMVVLYLISQKFINIGTSVSSSLKG